ncbi:uncharacterized protein LOC134823228 isoform X2 [Bolinopsis microptera]|uniref:uncharacterized protein LOC134823228 isoform X2 n=1 Tax=Bolinopsis microptera TaxID=2820187 RepID=UPI003079BE3C
MNILILVLSVFVFVSSTDELSQNSPEIQLKPEPEEFLTPPEPEVKSSRPAIGHMNTTMSVVCSLVNAPDGDGDVTQTWTRNSDGKEITDSDDGFSIASSQDDDTITSTLTIGATVNTQDDIYKCKFTSGDGTNWEGIRRVFLFIVTPHDATVNQGDSATLSCVMTDIVKNLTVTWEDDQGTEISKLPEHKFINGINIGGVQESSVMIENAVRNSTFTCTLYPYVNQPYSTEVHLLVNEYPRV